MFFLTVYKRPPRCYHYYVEFRSHPQRKEVIDIADTMLEQKRALLDRYRDSSAEIEDLAERIARLRSRAQYISAVLRDTPRSPLGAVPDRLQSCLAEALSLESLYSERLEENFALLDVLEHAIQRIPDPLDRRLLRMRCLDGRTWEQISAATFYSPRQLQRNFDSLLAGLELPADLLPPPGRHARKSPRPGQPNAAQSH